MIKSPLRKLLGGVEAFGIRNEFARFILLSLIFISNTYLDVLIYIYYPLESRIWLFSIWIIFGVLGAFLIGWVSDHSRKIGLLVSQFLGVIGLFVLMISGFNIWIILFLAVFYNPMVVVRAVLIYDLHEKTACKFMLRDCLRKF